LPRDDSGPKIIGDLARDRLGAVSAQAPAGFGVEIVGGLPHASGSAEIDLSTLVVPAVQLQCLFHPTQIPYG
jgi:hypothetical protein